ncbi:contact-dependent growth inhibition system immunity protein [Pseudomonas antarctica]|uniref:contact-dependent growth inhibition system immunity protein n=1 Tax=Pseudomonas antarctica TaxID=219572 RepID=UPI003F755F84
MNQDYPELQQFLAGYFNQDWVDDHKSADDVIDFFISDVSANTVLKVQSELDRLITTQKTEQELQDYLFNDIGCYYYYLNNWEDSRTWLRHIASTLESSKAQNKK